MNPRALFELLDGSPQSLREAAILYRETRNDTGQILGACLDFAAQMLEDGRSFAEVQAALSVGGDAFSTGEIVGTLPLSFAAVAAGTFTPAP